MVSEVTKLETTPQAVKSLPVVVESVSCRVVHQEDDKMNREQLRMLIRSVLQELQLYSEDAEEQLMLTAAVESNLGEYIAQVGGPAQGIFQMEPATEGDIWNNYLRYKQHLAEKIKALAGESAYRLRGNLIYQIAMARVHYLRVSEPLPSRHDVEGLAQYWKDHYNTFKGKGTVEKAVEKYEVYVA
jgi:hypothetical protein